MAMLVCIATMRIECALHVHVDYIPFAIFTLYSIFVEYDHDTM